MRNENETDRSKRLVGATIRPAWSGAEASLFPDAFTAVMDLGTADETTAAVHWDERRGWCVRVSDTEGEYATVWFAGASGLLHFLDGFVYSGAAVKAASN